MFGFLFVEEREGVEVEPQEYGVLRGEAAIAFELEFFVVEVISEVDGTHRGFSRHNIAYREGGETAEAHTTLVYVLIRSSSIIKTIGSTPDVKYIVRLASDFHFMIFHFEIV